MRFFALRSSFYSEARFSAPFLAIALFLSSSAQFEACNFENLLFPPRSLDAVVLGGVRRLLLTNFCET